MTTYTKLYDGISKVAWGYLFLYFDINIGTVSILPSFVGYILFLQAIKLLEDEERELTLISTLGFILAVWNVIEWVAKWFSFSFGQNWQFINIIIGLINLYFHFQLITNLATIATKYQQEGYEQDKKLLKYRTIQTIMLTVFLVTTNLSSLFIEAWAYISLTLGIVYIIVCICLMKALFDLRKCLREDDEIQFPDWELPSDEDTTDS